MVDYDPGNGYEVMNRHLSSGIVMLSIQGVAEHAKIVFPNFVVCSVARVYLLLMTIHFITWLNYLAILTTKVF